MAERNPPLYMDVADVYSGDELGLPYRDIIGEGVVGAASLAVSAGTGNTINVAAGPAWVLGDTDPNFQPCYRVYNDAVVNRGINPDPANPRKVLVVAQITDQPFAGVGRLWAITAIHGTPAAAPAEPALPASALPLALIDVPANAASSAAYTITDRRVTAKVGGGSLALAGASGGITVYRKTTLKDVVNTTAEVDLLNGEIVIGAGVMSTDKRLRVVLICDYLNNSGVSQTLTLAVKLGATTLWKDTLTGAAAISSAAVRRALRIELDLANLGVANSQFLSGLFWLSNPIAATAGLGDFSERVAVADDIWGGGFGGSAGEDTTLAKALAVTAQHGTANAALSCRLQYASVEVI